SIEEWDQVAEREENSEHLYVVPPAVLGDRMNGLLAQYMVVYALSIVARYKPHRWGEIMEGKRSVSLPVIETIMNISTRWWPNLMLNHLTGTWVCFAPQLYM
ncbi:MAG TPA: YaaC family protein, partial [Chloroflexota bacterium]|nr:YaaC family protein [Chloroflexota bacterium]